MRYLAGTSGFSYKEWKGNFYAEKIAPDEMLRSYAGRLPSVEIDNTFYRLPRADVLAGWAGQVPEEFRFTLKASRRITHFKRLKNAEDETDYLLRVTQELGPKLGAILFQLPPDMKKDRDRLARFLDLLPAPVPAVFEFRGPSWFDSEILELLRAHGRPLCHVDGGDGQTRNPERSESSLDPGGGALTPTASWGYLRLRGEAYDDESLREWIRKISETGWERTFVFFKHEEAGVGPALAQRFLELAEPATRKAIAGIALAGRNTVVDPMPAARAPARRAPGTARTTKKRA